jgi:3-methyladenine DNA glycosylase/8-oxoguanine DNA glycosylase
MMTSHSHARELHYSPPYDWQSVLAFFRSHRLPYLEEVDDTGYERVVRVKRGLGWFHVEQKSQDALLLSIWNGTEDDADRISQSVRWMFDLDADPAAIHRTMSADGVLSACWTRHPGLRLARFWDAYEALFTTVLGQLVSVSFGRVLIHELMQAAGPPARHPKTSEPISLFPSAKEILEGDLSKVRTSETRRATIKSIAQAISNGMLSLTRPHDLQALRKTLRTIPGVGAWTTEYWH